MNIHEFILKETKILSYSNVYTLQQLEDCMNKWSEMQIIKSNHALITEINDLKRRVEILETDESDLFP